MLGTSLLTLAAVAADGQTGRPGFSAAEQPAREPATCETLPAALAGLPEPRTRVDLTITGALTLARSEGALAYLAVCSDPGPRVLCVAYSANGLELGDRALLRGGYNRQDATHVVLDPCLASRAE